MPKPESHGPDDGRNKSTTGTERRVTVPCTSADLSALLEEYRDLSPEEAVGNLLADIYILESMRDASISGLTTALNEAKNESENACLEKEIKELLDSKEEWKTEMELLVAEFLGAKVWQKPSKDTTVQDFIRLNGDKSPEKIKEIVTDEIEDLVELYRADRNGRVDDAAHVIGWRAIRLAELDEWYQHQTEETAPEPDFPPIPFGVYERRHR